MKLLSPILFAILCTGFPAVAQEWRQVGGDAGGSRYSSLKQINRANVEKLHVAWTFKTGDLEAMNSIVGTVSFSVTPLVVDGVMYFTTPFCRLIALDASTGKQLWDFDPKIDRNRPYSNAGFTSRGVAYWQDGKEKRILFGTLDGRLFSIDATNGRPDPDFAGGKWVDLTKGASDDFPNRTLGMTSPPAVYKNVVTCGSLLSDSEPQGPKGDIRAFDVRTGERVWTFHVIPREEEFGNDTWAGDSWKGRGGANAWSFLSVDEERGLVFLPLTSPSYDFYGADRAGANLFGDSLVALDAATGVRRWHFQTIHHDIWDYDLPSQPVLVNVERDGREVPGVAQTTKTGFTFLFDRATGKPLFPVEERKVPPSDVPGEHAYPTQPFPLKPPPFSRQKMSPDELTNVTPESRAFCQELMEGAKFGDIYTPIGLEKTILFPSTNGGGNWGGASFDPQTHTLYVNSMEVGFVSNMIKRPEGSVVPYRHRGFGTRNSRFWDSNLYPCQKPPWGLLTAIDLDKGEFRWQSVLGVRDELIEKGILPTGSPMAGGSIVTAGGLVFIAATMDKRFRAFDKDTGKELWSTRLPAAGYATPMTFLDKKNNRQLVVVAAGGGNKYDRDRSDTLVAFCLP